MNLINDPKTMQAELRKLRSTHTIGFVPTMGALHQGHFSLIKKAQIENDFCVVSLFVNPTQFNDKKDFDTYPSTIEEDLIALKNMSVDYIFNPTFENIYPDEYKYEVIEKDFSKALCGKDRPGHFSGVLTVVLKLLQIISPQKAYFGEKDYQQLKLIDGMVKAFFIPTEIIACPIIRDSKGLALSSRNRKLSEFGLSRARKFAHALSSLKEHKTALNEIQKLGLDIDYLKDIGGRRFAAVKLEDVRLIDNVPL